ncbi:unnamed protein product [Arctia plantaginis]|uniref:CRAL-TRIO domain-containing protein n=1 Tax=Arctia plantaginis TaxID=874455 RepID=A0A8S1ADY6_ARCPL|nr:unnamed protein product [Arctia plantaginis]CAB3245637.1 unnamed protein product [Arctia plantaginis]
MESLTKSHLLEWRPNAVQEIRKIYNLDMPGRIEEAINILEKWVEKQDHFVKKDFKRDYLERTLIVCKGSVEKSKKQIDKLCTLKTLLPHFFTKTNVKSELRDILNLGCMVPMPVMTEDFSRVIILRNSDENLKEENITEFFQFNMILSEYLKANEYTNGIIVVFDFRQVNIINLITKINTVELQQFSSILIEGYGVRVKGIHVLTPSKAVELLVKLMKQFVSEKISSRIHVHNTMEEIYEYIPRELLPFDYGGNQKSFDKLSLEWVDELSGDKHVEYMKMMNKACTNESLRSKDTFNQEYMGMPGSFRNLSVD